MFCPAWFINELFINNIHLEGIRKYRSSVYGHWINFFISLYLTTFSLTMLSLSLSLSLSLPSTHTLCKTNKKCDTYALNSIRLRWVCWWMYGKISDWRKIRRVSIPSVSTLLGLHQQCIPWSLILGIEPAITELKLYNRATGPHLAKVLPNQLVIVIARLINLMCLLNCVSNLTWFAGFSGHSNSIYNLIPSYNVFLDLKTNVQRIHFVF